MIQTHFTKKNVRSFDPLSGHCNKQQSNSLRLEMKPVQHDNVFSWHTMNMKGVFHINLHLQHNRSHFIWYVNCFFFVSLESKRFSYFCLYIRVCLHYNIRSLFYSIISMCFTDLVACTVNILFDLILFRFF